MQFADTHRPCETAEDCENRVSVTITRYPQPGMPSARWGVACSIARCDPRLLPVRLRSRGPLPLPWLCHHDPAETMLFRCRGFDDAFTPPFGHDSARPPATQTAPSF